MTEICRHCRGRGWISAGIYGCEPCDCEEIQDELPQVEPREDEEKR